MYRMLHGYFVIIFLGCIIIFGTREYLLFVEDSGIEGIFPLCTILGLPYLHM